MLVLKRKRGETIWIGKDIQVTVVDIQGGKVRLGISAPRDVSVDRLEERASRQEVRETRPGGGGHAQG